MAMLLMCVFGVHAKQFQIEDGKLRFSCDSKNKTATVQKCIKPSYTGTISIPEDLLCDDGTYTVKSIDACAFMNCKLKAIHFPSTLTKIGSSAFEGCSNFYKDKGFTIPSGVTKIEMEAFKGCKFIKVTIPSTVKTIGEGAFENSKIKTVVFEKPKSTLSLGDRAFCGCKSLTSADMPSGVNKMGQGVFENCTALATVSVPGTVKTIPAYGFHGCTALKTVTLASGVTKIDFNAFQAAGLESLRIPDTVTAIGQYAFAASTIRSVVLPAPLKSVGYCVFTGCESLTSVTLPAGLVTIESGAFYECKALPSIHLGRAVTDIGQAAFYGCDKLMAVTSDNPTPPDCTGTVFGDATLNNARLTVPEASVLAYSNAVVWSDFRWLLNTGVEGVAVDMDNTDAAVYYDLNGTCHTERPTVPGVYVRRTGNRTSKIYIR